MHGHKKTSHLPIRNFLALLWAHPILHISTIRVKVCIFMVYELYICILYSTISHRELNTALQKPVWETIVCQLLILINMFRKAT